MPRRRNTNITRKYKETKCEVLCIEDRNLVEYECDVILIPRMSLQECVEAQFDTGKIVEIKEIATRWVTIAIPELWYILNASRTPETEWNAYKEEQENE